MKMSKNYFHAIATLVGTIIGVGMFAVPYVISKAGIVLLFIYLPVLGAVMYFIHKIYAEIILSTKTKHRIPGYVEKYFSVHGKAFALIIVLVSGYGALLAYIIVGGIFLHQLLNPIIGGSLFFYTTILYIFEIVVVLVGLKLIASVELIMTSLLFLVVGLIAWRGWGYISLDNYVFINWQNIFLPYGLVLFSVSGGSAIPVVCKLLAHKKEDIKSAIAWGTFIPVVIILTFVAVTVGITGINTSPDTLVGLNLIIKDGVIIFALIFGVLSIITSFLVVAQATKEVYWWDFKINKNIAWVLACFMPYILYLAGWHNLTKVVGLTGAVTGGLIGIIIICLLFKVKKRGEQSSVIKNKLNKSLAFILAFLFVLGLIHEIWVFFK